MLPYYPFPMPEALRQQELTYVRKPQGSWTTDWIDQELPYIKGLRAVSNAWREGEYLYVQTKDLALRHGTSRLPAILIKLHYANFRKDFIGMKYVSKLNGFVNRHPSINTRIGLKGYLYECLGDNLNDLIKAMRQGPYMAVIASLGILQTIRGDSHARRSSDVIIPREAIFLLPILMWVGLMISLIISH